ncbi:translation elongation factor Ts [Pseudonocardia sp.]|jgi:elongation factor Ts|uniref:translation elongation factor Ts n=1 Tax=Pseudonocardia sp. TaxID=60912 RepID=UPI0031FBB401
MANYTAAEVKKLRELTGAGMMDCKNALEQADGNIEQAVEALREKSAKSVDKRTERTTTNGLVAASGGTMIELNSETDFVAKSADFIELAETILQVAVEQQPADVEALNAAPLGDGTVLDAVQALSGRIGEKLQIKRYVHLDGPVAVYLHRRATDLPPAIGTVVSYEGADSDAARSVAMHIAAAQPRYTTREEVPADVLEAQRREAEATAKEEGKPEQIVPRIVEGKIKKFYADSVLLEQVSVLDESKKTMKDLVDEAGLTVRGFARFEVGHA